jgi:hypothetical protein
VYRGVLDSPNVLTESYWQDGSAVGTERAALDVRAHGPIRLTVDCHGGHRSAVGMQHISLDVTARPGGCVVTISSPGSTPGPVPYHLTIDRGRL